jgi:hypothetical protein
MLASVNDVIFRHNADSFAVFQQGCWMGSLIDLRQAAMNLSSESFAALSLAGYDQAGGETETINSIDPSDTPGSPRMALNARTVAVPLRAHAVPYPVKILSADCPFLVMREAFLRVGGFNTQFRSFKWAVAGLSNTFLATGYSLAALRLHSLRLSPNTRSGAETAHLEWVDDMIDATTYLENHDNLRDAEG